MLKKISLALALTLVSSSVFAASKSCIDFGVDATFNIENYMSGTASNASTGSAINAVKESTLYTTGFGGVAGGTLTTSLVYGATIKAAYYRGFALLGDVSYKMANLTSGQISGLNIANKAVLVSATSTYPILGADLAITTDAYSNFKTKAAFGLALPLRTPDSFVTPFVGVSYKFRSQTVSTAANKLNTTAATVPPTFLVPIIATNSLWHKIGSNPPGTDLQITGIKESNALWGIPVGINFKLAPNDSAIGFEFQGAWHFLFSAQTTTPRGDIAGSIGYAANPAGSIDALAVAGDAVALIQARAAILGINPATFNAPATNNVYNHLSATPSSMTTNYSFDLSGSILFFMSGAEFGLNSIGLGVYYEYDCLAATLPSTVNASAVNGVAATNFSISTSTSSLVAPSTGTLEAITAYEAGLKVSFNF